MKDIIFKKITAKAISYGDIRGLDSIKKIVFHYTGNEGDSAENNAKYFGKNGGNTRQAGAHFFIDKNGNIVRSIPMTRIAYSVGGDMRGSDGGGRLYGKYGNSNTVSIELCDLVDGSPSWEQMKAARDLTLYIKSKCPNINGIVRHWDINGKKCPGTMTGKNNKEWEHFHRFLVKGFLYHAVITDECFSYEDKNSRSNRIKCFRTGDRIKVVRESKSYVKLKEKKFGKSQWVSKKKIKEI